MVGAGARGRIAGLHRSCGINGASVGSRRGRRNRDIHRVERGLPQRGRQKKGGPEGPPHTSIIEVGPKAHPWHLAYLKKAMMLVMTPYRYAEALGYVVDAWLVSTR